MKFEIKNKNTSMQEITCKCGCGNRRMVRTADVKRGWGLYFNKSCKAKHQEKNTHQYANYMNGRSSYYSDDDYALTESEAGWDGHKY